MHTRIWSRCDMLSCCFFGHRDSDYSNYDKIEERIKYIIEKNGVCNFYVGNNGNYDKMVITALRKIKHIYPQISYAIVLAYLPKDNSIADESVFPEGIEYVPKKFAIPFRNRWMIDHSDYVIANVNRSYGGAAKYLKMAQRKGKRIFLI